MDKHCKIHAFGAGIPYCVDCLKDEQAAADEDSRNFIANALTRYANMDDETARGYRIDAENCSFDPSEVIQERAAVLLHRAEILERKADQYRRIIYSQNAIGMAAGAAVPPLESD